MRGMITAVAALLFFTGLAAARPLVQLHLTVFHVVHVGDKVKVLPVGHSVLKIGDILKYVVSAKNAGHAPALDLTPVGQIPKATAYIPGSAQDGGVQPEFTLDGKSWSPKPLISVKTPKGTVKKPADPSLYRSIRWVLKRPLPPGKTLAFSYEVRVK